MNKISLAIIAILIIFGGVVVVRNNAEKQTTDRSELQSGTSTVISGKKLDLSNRGLKSIPSTVFGETNLESLDVSNNALGGSIQAEIRHLGNLKILDASDNQMTGVPAEIGQLEKLEVLDLSNNKLTGLPYELGNLRNLKTLNLSGNDYSKADLDIIRKGLSQSTHIIVD